MPDQRHPTTESLTSTAELTTPPTKLVWPKPRKKFSVIVADPPWDKYQKGERGAGRHYDLMNLESIMNMPVEDLAEENAQLWLWSTNSSLHDAYHVMEKWGFTDRMLYHWDKPVMGLGIYGRNASEPVILGTRGKAPVKFRSQPNWFFGPRQDHSHKPEEFFAIVERLYDGPYLELFARRYPSSNKDWSVWGNEIESDIFIPGYPVPKYSDKAVIPIEKPISDKEIIPEEVCDE